jgi:hypothetical protein
VIGAAQSPARAIYPPTAIAPLVPMLGAPEAVPRAGFHLTITSRFWVSTEGPRDRRRNFPAESGRG